MDDPRNISDPNPPERVTDRGGQDSLRPLDDLARPHVAPSLSGIVEGTNNAADEGSASERRSFRHDLGLLLSLALAAFILTSWILIRFDAPLGRLSSGPQEIVRAQLRALDRGELRPAYNMFSARYRKQVSYDAWHELVITHWRMFHADVVRAGAPEPSGPGISLEYYLHGADDKDYRAHFTLIRADGRWWIDDVHWAEEQDAHDLYRI